MTTPQEREFHCWSAESVYERAAKKDALSQFVKYFQDCQNMVDLGCGDGVFLELLLTSYPGKKCIGVETNDELIEMCKSLNLPVIKDDAVAFMQREHQRYDGFVMLDMVEHLDFEANLEIMSLIPAEAILLIKTPNTNSLLGHQYYLQSPSHKLPYCPFVLKNMLHRTGFTIVEEGECNGYSQAHSVLRLGNKIRLSILKLLFIGEFSRVFGGGNYFVVAKKSQM